MYVLFVYVSFIYFVDSRYFFFRNFVSTNIFLLQVQHYILVVQAQDAGHPVLSSTLTVYCNVLDLNDNAPLFDPMSYSNDIFENVTIGTSVVTVSATDLDSGNS